jgi:flagellar basal-body rod modification protein FlgD
MTTSIMPPVAAGKQADANPYAVLNGKAAADGAPGGDKADPTSAQGIQDRFLTLLTTQLRAQDPTNPMDNSQITSQMAQISSVTGLQNLNQSMQSMLQAQRSSQSLLASTTVGRQALVAGNTLQWDANTRGVAAIGAVSLDGPAEHLTVSVLNAAGQPVDSFNIDKPQVGMNAFSWDGHDSNGKALPAGQYTFNVDASLPGKEGPVQVPATSYANQTISGVAMDNTGAPQVVLSNGTRMALSDVKQIC